MESCCLPGATQKNGTKEEAKCVHGVPALGERGLLVTTSRKLQVRILGFPGGSDGKESTCKAENLGLIPGLGRYPGEGNGYPLQYSGLENSIACTIHGVTKSQTWLGGLSHTSSETGYLFRTQGGPLERELLQVCWVRAPGCGHTSSIRPPFPPVLSSFHLTVTLRIRNWWETIHMVESS